MVLDCARTDCTVSFVILAVTLRESKGEKDKAISHDERLLLTLSRDEPTYGDFESLSHHKKTHPPSDEQGS